MQKIVKKKQLSLGQSRLSAFATCPHAIPFAYFKGLKTAAKDGNTNTQKSAKNCKYSNFP